MPIPVQTLFVDERSSLRALGARLALETAGERSVDMRSTRLVRAFVAFLVCLACMSIDRVAQASAMGHSGRQDAAYHHHGDDRESGWSATAALQYRDNADAPPESELHALTPEDVEEGADADAPSVALPIHFTPIEPLPTEAVRLVSAAWTSQFLVASALPRGPPSSKR